MHILLSFIAVVSSLFAVVSTPAVAADNHLSARNALSLCTIAQPHWVDFCNGLMQGYADYASLAGKACFPAGIKRTDLVQLFEANVRLTEAWQQDNAAILASTEVFSREFPCK